MPRLPYRSVLLISLVVLCLCFGDVHSRAKTVAQHRLKIMTYNIHVGVGMDKQLDLQRIADVILKEKPDLVGLQEVDRGVKRTQGIDEIVKLAQMTHMEYAFAHNLDFQGGQYGVAILSRLPIKSSDHKMFQNKREAERRGMLRIVIELAGKDVNFVTTHLDYQYDDGRMFEMQQLLTFINDLTGPVIVVGDLNDEPIGAAYQLINEKFNDSWVQSKASGTGFTYPADTPRKRIDYIFFRESDGLRVKKAWTVSTLASDHIPLVSELEFRR